jgi:hypothetical protein
MKGWPGSTTRAWWAKYRKWIIVLVIVYVLLVLALIVLTSGAQRDAFRYQIF